MDLVALTNSYAEAFDKKNIKRIGDLMSDVFTLTDGVVNKLAPKKEVIPYIWELMQSNSSKFEFEVIEILEGLNFTTLEFKLYLNDEIFHGVDLIQWQDGLMVDMRAFLNNVSI
jgi:hypothetical protein